jgi:hypothetical protein
MASIVQLPRAFQVSLVFVFDSDERTDQELMVYLLDRIAPALSLGQYGKGASCQRVTVPPGLTHQGAALPPSPPS